MSKEIEYIIYDIAFWIYDINNTEYTSLSNAGQYIDHIYIHTYNITCDM